MITNKNGNQESLNLAFFGGGINSAVGRVHNIAVRMDGCFDLVSGCFSRHADINFATAREYGVAPERVYSNREKLIEKEKNRIDAVVVLTPTPHHAEDIMSFLHADIPVICEKAMAASPCEAKLIKNLLDEKSGFLAVTYNYTGYPMVRELRRMIQQGRLGKLEQIHIEMPQEGFARLDKEGNPKLPQEWRLHDNALPTISLDLGVHLHHMIGFLSGETPLKVVAQENSFGSFRNIVDNAVCLAQYTNNLMCSIWYSKAALGHRNGLRVRIYGETGSAEWYQLDPEVIYFNDNHGIKIVMDRGGAGVEIAVEDRYNRFKPGHSSGFVEAFANHYKDISDSLQEYISTRKTRLSPYVFGIQEATEGLRMLKAISDSAKSESWERLSE